MTALRNLTSAAAATIYDAINRVDNSDDLDHLARLMWQGRNDGAISDDDAAFLDSYIARRRGPGRMSATGHLKAAGPVIGRSLIRLGSRFKPRQRPRLSDPQRKAARERRRMLGGSGVLPANLRHHYTLGQMSVLCIMAGEVKHHGVCDLPNDKIAALAGVCRTTVQTTMHEARRLGHITITPRPQPGRKSLPNVVEIISREWLTWIKRGPAAHRPIGSNSFAYTNLVSPTKNTDSLKKEAADEERQGRGHGPPPTPMRRRA